MRQILCVIDLTGSSGQVLEVAAGMANSCKAHLIVMFPYRLIDYGYSGDITSLKAKLETEARQKFQQLKNKLPDFENLSCEFQPEIGFLADRISAHVKKRDIDMVVIGQQQSITTNDVKGFNLQQLIANSKLPFMIVPEEVSAEAVFR